VRTDRESSPRLTPPPSCRGERTRVCSPGDIVTVAGIFLAVCSLLPPLLPLPSQSFSSGQVRYSGFRAIKAGLQADTFIEAMAIAKNKQGYEEVLQNPFVAPGLDQQVRSPPFPPSGDLPSMPSRSKRSPTTETRTPAWRFRLPPRSSATRT
jgi:hypothetical protein